jgi:fructose-bisphosphate aldolase, class I
MDPHEPFGIFGARESRQWRNWQTHQLEGLAGATLWRFESSLPHHSLSGLSAQMAVSSEKRSMAQNQLEQVARKLVAPGKGILAADESSGTIEKRLKSISTPSTEDNRRAYREMLFRTEGAEQFVSGVILYDETIRQKAADGTPLVELLEKQGIVPGIKVDLGAKALPFAAGETITEGLDGLRERLAAFKELGARFAKWRATYSITDVLPSALCVDANAHALARYAALCQEAGIVPIVEPEVLMDGDHTIERSEEVTTAVLEAVFAELHEQRCMLEGLLLKPNMVLSGYSGASQASDADIAAATVRCFERTVPAAVPGIVFLSGGQSDEAATSRLNQMNLLGAHPWQLSFSYGRALQAPALAAWRGQTANVAAGKAAYLHRARLNGAARNGSYRAEMEAVA